MKGREEGEGERIKDGNDGGGCAVERADRPSGAVEDGLPMPAAAESFCN